MWINQLFALLGILVFSSLSYSQDNQEPKPKSWYEKYSIRGYTQIRYNLLASSDRALQSENDKSIGDSNSFFIRRARLILSGDVTDHVFIYIQPDFASSISGSGVTYANHFAQIRDFYADIAVDSKKEFRFRVGQSKVPYGFENLQSSQNRIPLDRADGLNSAVPNERDLGIFFYWAPAEIRARFKHLVDSGLKGSGDYGVVGFGVHNGQTANRSESNNNRHFVGRITYPWELQPGGQIIEAGLQAYSGEFTPTRSGTIQGAKIFEDKRIGTSLIVYPQPIGFQAEYNWGRGAQLNTLQNSIEDTFLRGGYVMAMYHLGPVFPFVRMQHYRGGRKTISNAGFSKLREFDAGVEWQVFKSVELTANYTLTDRTTTSSPYKNVRGDLIRFQLQVNY